MYRKQREQWGGGDKGDIEGWSKEGSGVSGPAFQPKTFEVKICYKLRHYNISCCCKHNISPADIVTVTG